MVRYSISGINSHGQRVLAFHNWKRYFKNTRKAAEKVLKAIQADPRSVAVMTEMWKDIRVDGFDCYDQTGEAKSHFVTASN